MGGDHGGSRRLSRSHLGLVRVLTPGVLDTALPLRIHAVFCLPLFSFMWDPWGGPMTMFMNVSLHFGPEGGQCRGLNACLSLSLFMVTRECGQRWDFQ